MKRVLIFILTISLCFCFAACKTKTVTENREEVKINLAEDDTVNGYRVSFKKSTTMPETIKGELVGTEGEDNKYTIDSDLKGESTTVSETYCANKNSKIFHKTTCGSVAKIKEENKAYFSDRTELISQGYKPCKSCTP